MLIGETIAKFRREKGWTQAELGERIGVSNQAVSKWESGVSMPDILMLPTLADVFGCTVDALFERETPTGSAEPCEALPWEDDGVVRCIVCAGRRILKVGDERCKELSFRLIGDAPSVSSQCSITVEGSVNGDCTAGTHISVGADVSGDCTAGTHITAGCDITGECVARTHITAGAEIIGDCVAGRIQCTKHP